MPTVTMGYDAGGAKDYTTLAAAIAGATAGDTIEIYYGDASLSVKHAPGANQDIPKNLTFDSGITPIKPSFIRGSGHSVFQPATAGVTATIRNLSLGSQSHAVGIYAASSGSNLTFDRCRFSAKSYGINLNGGSTTVTVTSCEFIGCEIGAAVNDAGSTLTVENSAALGCTGNGFRNFAGTMDCYNCLVMHPANAGYFGTIGGSNNASDDNTHPGTGGVDFRAADTKTMIHGHNGYTAYSCRPVDATCALVGAGTDRSLTTDIDGQTINQATSANIGPYGVVVPLSTATCSAPTAPTISAVDDGDGANSTITVSSSDAGSTNDLYQWQESSGWSQSSLTSGGSNNATRTGDGTIQIAMTPGVYFLRVDSIDANSNQAVSNILQHVQASTGRPKIEEALVSLLEADSDITGIVSTRIYPDIAPQSAKAPFLVYRRTDVEHNMHMGNAGGIAKATVEIEGYCTSKAQATDLADEIKHTLHGYNGTVTVSSETLTVRGIWMNSEDQDYEPPVDGQSRPVFSFSMSFTAGYVENVTTF